jgi:transcriptional regulator with GAF, ATPase, and Fis domain
VAARPPAGLREAERRHVLGILEAEQWDLARAAAALEVNREDLETLIARHGLTQAP